jgi:hypothetical protein
MGLVAPFWIDRHFEISNKWNSMDNHVAFPKCIHVLKTVKKWLNGTKNFSMRGHIEL